MWVAYFLKLVGKVKIMYLSSNESNYDMADMQTFNDHKNNSREQCFYKKLQFYISSVHVL